MSVVQGDEPEIDPAIHVLNCRPAGTLLPKATRVFAMVLRLSPAASPGRRVLHWFIKGGPSDFARLVVRA